MIKHFCDRCNLEQPNLKAVAIEGLMNSEFTRYQELCVTCRTAMTKLWNEFMKGCKL